MNIGSGLISGERSFLVGVYSGGPISVWAYKRDGSFVRTKIKQYSHLQSTTLDHFSNDNIGAVKNEAILNCKDFE